MSYEPLIIAPREYARELSRDAYHVLMNCSLEEKCNLSQEYAAKHRDLLKTLAPKGDLMKNIITYDAKPKEIFKPGRPQKPTLVAPRLLPRRRMSTIEGQAIMVHAIAHIEMNAIDLAWDAVYRFSSLPFAFYADWLKVAAEETKHFMLLRDYLLAINYDYGSFAAHNSLWEMAYKTSDDPLVRMALVPRIMEARGLDVVPGLIKRFEALSCHKVVEILKIIEKEERGHVAIGNRWYYFLCAQRDVPPLETFIQLVEQKVDRQIRKPFLRQARLDAGFKEEEVAYLEEKIRQLE